MAEPLSNVSYRLEQSVTIMQRESERSEPVSESYQRVGLVLLEAESAGGAWNRELSEYIVGADRFAEIGTEFEVSRFELEQAHDGFQSSKELEFGLEMPLNVTSDLANSDPHLPSVPPGLIRYDWLYLPTVVQSFPPQAEAEPVGQKWSGTIKVGVGAGEFELDYDAECVAVDDDGVTTVITFREDPLENAFEHIVLELTPSGSFEILTPQRGSPPSTVKGSYSIGVRANYENMEGSRIDVQVLSATVEYQLVRLITTFDDDRVFPNGFRPVR